MSMHPPRGSDPDHPIKWPVFPAPVTPPLPVRPRYVQETLREAIARVPALGPLSRKPADENAAAMFELVDTMPGYSLVQAVPDQPSAFGLRPVEAVFVFRRIDPPRAPIALQTF